MDNKRTIPKEELENEAQFTASTSSGPGGQHVNKANTKVTLRFDVTNSTLLSDEEKETIRKKLSSKLTKDGVLILRSQEKRSQLQNKQAVLAKAEKLLTQALIKRKKRKPTKPSKGAVQDRLNKKKQQGEKKKWRQNIY